MNTFIKILGCISFAMLLTLGSAIALVLLMTGIEMVGLFKLNETSGFNFMVGLLLWTYYSWIPISVILLYKTFRKEK